METANLPKSRAEAKAAGSRWYFTGEPCVRGHLEPRFTSIGKCMQCARDEARKQHTPVTNRKRLCVDTASFKRLATEVHGGKYDYTHSVFTTAHAKLTILCPEHGEFAMSPTNHLQGKGCRKCASVSTAAKQIKTLERFIEQSVAVWGAGAFDYSRVEYAGAKRPVVLRCIEHDNVFEQTPESHLMKNSGCSRCARKKSRPQAAIADYIRSFGFEVVENVTRPNVLGRFEADIWVPALRLAVEHHGLYYHRVDTSAADGKQARMRDRHRAKWEAAQKNGVRLVQVFGDEWETQRSVVESRLRSVLGVSRRRFARKLQLSEINTRDAKVFFQKYHLQGGGNASVAYGLFEGETLVAAASFCKARGGAMVASGEDGWEVLRYASDETVVGGFSRLFKAFVRDFAPKRVVSYCDLRYGVGRVYESAGFVLDGVTEPDYWWLTPDSKQRVPRYQTQKHKLKAHPVFGAHYADDRTEREICEAAGYTQVYGVGNQRWLWTPQ